MNLYRVRNWESIYENNRTREMKLMQWIPLPIKLSGSGYSYLMTLKDGPAIFGCFVALLELSGRCEPRGTLLRGAGIPHSSRTLAAVIRQPEKLVQKTLDVCSSDMCDWLTVEICENSQESEQAALFPQEGAEIPQEGAGCLRYRTGQDKRGEDKTGEERKGRPHSFESSPFFDIEVLKAALPDWPETKVRHYWQAANDYSESKGAKYLNWKAAISTWARNDEKKNLRPISKFGPQTLTQEDVLRQAEMLRDL